MSTEDQKRTEEWTFAAILADLQEYLSGDECTDPIGYLETVELRLMAAITRSDSRELGLPS